LWLWGANGCFGRSLEKEVVNVLVNKETFVHKTISEPDIDVVELGNVFQIAECHFFANFPNGGLAVTLTRSYMTLRKGPLAI
jgi:hypothetical protein